MSRTGMAREKIPARIPKWIRSLLAQGEVVETKWIRSDGMNGNFDIAILGAGPGGYVAALRAAHLGARVALIEKSEVGGTCLNRGCVPSKAFLAAAELLHDIRHRSVSIGIKAGEPSFDWSAILSHKNGILADQRKGLRFLFEKRGIRLYEGEGQFEAPHRLAVKNAKGTEQVQAKAVIIAAGSRPARIPGWPVDERVVTSDEALDWTTLPKSLIIVGGGVIGSEFACMMAEFGVKVTLVEMLPKLVNLMDDDLGSELLKIFKKRKIACHLDTKVDDLELTDSGVAVRLSSGAKVEAEKVLVATGRRPNSDDLNLQAIGVELNRGFIAADDQMRTSVAGHFAIGDITGKIQLAHSASAMGQVAAENALGHGSRFTAPSPWCVYTFPEIGGVGLSEQQAKEQGLPIAIGLFPFSASGKAKAYGDATGFVKVVRHREIDEILGIHAIGHAATEFIAAAGVLVHTKAKATDVAEMIFAHPTMNEAIREAVEGSLFQGLHMPPSKILRLSVG